MGKISLSDTSFKPANLIYSRVKRRLKSFDITNSLDEGEFPVYTKDVLRNLGLGVYMELDGVTEVIDGKACLPYNYYSLYAAYKCSPDFACSGHIRKHLQGSSFSYNTEITDQILLVNNTCEIDCCSTGTKAMEYVTVNTYVQEEGGFTFNNLRPLNINPNVGNGFMPTSPLDIRIQDKILYANFTDDFIYFKYYGFPINEKGELLVPDIQRVEEAIEWYIIYQVLLSCWFDSSVQDIQNKWQVAELKYNEAFASAKNYLKTPSFAQMVNSIRNQRNNKLVYFTGQYSNTNFQTSY